MRNARPLAWSPWLVLVFALSAGCRDDDPASGETDGSSSESTGTSSSSSSSGSTTGEDNQPPPTPMLVSPSDGDAEVAIRDELCWDTVTDPDGDEVRYRVWIDGIELDNGKLGEAPGHAGPCLGPLDFNHAQTYAWTVSAFEVDHPEHESEQADLFEFTTVANESSAVAFDDDFDDDEGWELGGDALSGAWVRGDPVQTEVGTALAQPGDCAGGASCYFTGQNPDAVPDQSDVHGGSTTLTSPPFDLSGFATAAVTLHRFFYRSEPVETGTLLRVELLVPDGEETDGYRSFVLEQLELEDDVAGANSWTPVEYTACSVPMVEGAKLRITATDLGEGITEAAIDSVLVTGYYDGKLCNGGAGSVCDPENIDSCSDGYLCCPQGTFNTGVYRCAEPVQQFDYDNPPSYAGPMGCDAPDLLVTEIGMDVFPDTIFVSEDPGDPSYCVLLEGCVDGPGQREILRFDTNTPNQGSADLRMGVPANHPDLFHFSQCHGHYHFDGYARYELLDAEGNQAATGHKQAFCLIDFENWSGASGSGYGCFNQGISAGWQDNYYTGLDCQWIDITDVPSGNYTLRITVNGPEPGTSVPPVVENDYSNNVLERAVIVP